MRIQFSGLTKDGGRNLIREAAIIEVNLHDSKGAAQDRWVWNKKLAGLSSPMAPAESKAKRLEPLELIANSPEEFQQAKDLVQAIKEAHAVA